MIRVATVAEMKAWRDRERAAGRAIGFVPTMGALHEGHLSLVRESVRRSGRTVVSVFVNPAQFGPAEDFSRYPRDLEGDARLLEAAGADALFAPETAEVYPAGFRTIVEVPGLQDKLCGASRPGHFRGVCTVVLKLLEVVRPDRAFFGWKDAQQVLVVRRMAKDLDLDVEIVPRPIVREPDGLAMSSRNRYLDPEERRAALALSRGLDEARRLAEAGERRAAVLVDAAARTVAAEPRARLDYVAAVDPETLEPVEDAGGGALLALAAFFGGTRLIDNLRLPGPRWAGLD